MAADFNAVYLMDIPRKNSEKVIKNAKSAAKIEGLAAEVQTVESFGGQAAEFIVEEAKSGRRI